MSVETFIPNTQVISMTDTAIAHFETSLANKPGSIIRFSTKMSGCTGYAYVLDFADSPKEGDEVIEFSDKLTVAIASDAVGLIKDTEIDYVKAGVNGIIQYNNPNVVNECGCGESFNVG